MYLHLTFLIVIPTSMDPQLMTWTWTQRFRDDSTILDLLAKLHTQTLPQLLDLGVNLSYVCAIFNKTDRVLGTIIASFPCAQAGMFLYWLGEMKQQYDWILADSWLKTAQPVENEMTYLNPLQDNVITCTYGAVGLNDVQRIKLVYPGDESAFRIVLRRLPMHQQKTARMPRPPSRKSCLMPDRTSSGS